MKRRNTLAQSLLVDLFYLVASPVIILVYLVLSRCLTRAKYRRGMVEKLGYVPLREGDERSIWIHAVSVGEVQTAVPLVERLGELLPDWDISISVSTFTGLEVASRRFRGHTVFYAPLDLSFCVTRTFHRRRPHALLLVELELWPNFLLVAQRLGVPALVVNGRLSASSCRGYRRAGPLGRWLFSLVDRYAVQNEEYARRFRSLGVADDRIEVLGNLKHDRHPGVEPGEATALRESLGWGAEKRHVILVGGSTHPGEESMLCRLLERLSETEPGLRLVLAPRHVERLKVGEESSWGAQRPIRRWTRWRESESPEPLGADILLVDTVGELERLYAAADLVVVGGSFVPHGGHNVFEPARLARPTCFGPSMSNFRDEARVLLEARGGVQVEDEEELFESLRAWLEQPVERRECGERALAALEKLRGAVERHTAWVRAAL